VTGTGHRTSLCSRTNQHARIVDALLKPQLAEPSLIWWTAAEEGA
jgi:hypothetical protein